MRLIKTSIICLAIELAGCASGIKYKDMAASIPPVAPDMGRIFFYRTRSMVGAAVQPSIVLDGEKVGNSQPGGFFYVDRAPGVHEIKVATEAEKTRTLRLALREVKYVKTSLDFGFLVGRPVIDVMDPEAGAQDLPDLSYTGDQTAASSAVRVAAISQAQPAQAAQPAPGAAVQASANPAAAAAPAFTGGPVETWNGVMSCDARRGSMPNVGSQPKNAARNARAAYQANFDVEVEGSAVRLQRQPSPYVTESLSGQIADNMLVLSGEGYRMDAPDVKWNIKISGNLQSGAPSYAGRGGMFIDGNTIRNCELTMARTAPSQAALR